ncbi:MAG: putative porin [candidate division Zixibacteria bacterium]|nr:putative porin [candidate division Zixibacteria bacterium]
MTHGYRIGSVVCRCEKRIMEKGKKMNVHEMGRVLILGLAGAIIAGNTVASNWSESITIKGDLRYRHEMIEAGEEDARHRQRIRARLGVYANVSPYTQVGIRLATGSTDPISTNQTLDGASSTKTFSLDLAYFETYHEAVPCLRITAGKLKNPFIKPAKSELIWDGDWNPEGGAVTINKTLGQIDLTMIGAGLWLDERASGDDSYLVAGQGIGRFHFNDGKSTVAVGVGFFNYVNTLGFEPYFDHDHSAGNTTVPYVEDEEVDTVLHYANDYDLIEVFGEITHKFQNTPVLVMADYVTNSGAYSLETGWLVGFQIGKAKKSGSWQLNYFYREVEKDAVVGAFTSSDFGGGGTDSKGHVLGGAVQLARNTVFKMTYFINETGLSEYATEDFKRLQFDLQLKF